MATTGEKADVAAQMASKLALFAAAAPLTRSSARRRVRLGPRFRRAPKLQHGGSIDDSGGSVDGSARGSVASSPPSEDADVPEDAAAAAEVILEEEGEDDDDALDAIEGARRFLDDSRRAPGRQGRPPVDIALGDDPATALLTSPSSLSWHTHAPVSPGTAAAAVAAAEVERAAADVRAALRAADRAIAERRAASSREEDDDDDEEREEATSAASAAASAEGGAGTADG